VDSRRKAAGNTHCVDLQVSMEGLVEGAFGHWGGSVLWDADYWIYPAISMFRPSFQRDIIQ
jgi:trehalose/maltose hydrolase-like predicted phosphorylase